MTKRKAVADALAKARCGLNAIKIGGPQSHRSLVMLMHRKERSVCSESWQVHGFHFQISVVWYFSFLEALRASFYSQRCVTGFQIPNPVSNPVSTRTNWIGRRSSFVKNQIGLGLTLAGRTSPPVTWSFVRA